MHDIICYMLDVATGTVVMSGGIVQGGATWTFPFGAASVPLETDATRPGLGGYPYFASGTAGSLNAHTRNAAGALLEIAAPVAVLWEPDEGLGALMQWFALQTASATQILNSTYKNAP